MSTIDDLIRRLCPDGVEQRALGDLGKFERGSGIQKADFVEGGVGCIHYGQIHTHYGTWATETKSFVTPEHAVRCRRAKTGDLVIATTSEDDEAVGKAVAWLGAEEVAVSTDAFIYRHSLDSKYVAYYFQTEHFHSQKRWHVTGAKVRRIGGGGLAKIRIPVPPIEVQREIVRVLDMFQSLEAELEAELKARRRQFAHYLQRLLLEPSDPTARWGTLGELGRVSTCRRIFKAETSTSGDVPFYKIGTFGSAPDAYISRERYEDYRGRYAFPGVGDVLLSAAGTIGRAISYDGADAYFQDSNIVWIANDEKAVTNRFLRYWYQVAEWSTEGGTIQRLYNDNLQRVPILIPSLAEQQRIVDLLDTFDDLVNGVTEPVKAFETTARHYFCASLPMVGLLIHAAVGSFGGLGRRFPNRHGLAA